ncbi:hypothetical protein ACVJGC_005222 [Bradyrhizobium diazoefficiens]|jgi:hypothetical protein
MRYASGKYCVPGVTTWAFSGGLCCIFANKSELKTELQDRVAFGLAR